MTTNAELIAAIDSEEQSLGLTRFTPDDAWWLGSRLRELAAGLGTPVAVAIRRGDVLLFQTLLDGATADNAGWAARKIAVATRFERSSYAVALRMRDRGTNFVRYGLEEKDYAAAGGGVPIRVEGIGVIGGVAVSGLPEEEDHALVIRALRELAQKQAGKP